MTTIDRTPPTDPRGAAAPVKAARRPLRDVGWHRFLGLFLVLHGLAHALGGMRAMDEAAGWLDVAPGAGSTPLLIAVTVLWLIAMAGFVGAGLGALGARPWDRIWGRVALAATASSIVLLGVARPPGALVGLVLDLGVLGALAAAAPRLVAEAASPPAPVGGPWRRRFWLARDVLGVAVVVWLALVVMARPWHMRWGMSDAQLHETLPGDELTPLRPSYAIQHGITIHAPADAVWPWLAQIGEDRGGFYSHAGLENLLGLRLRNAERVHPEWQDVRAGDTIWAVPPGWLGMKRRAGWRVSMVVPRRALVLENWGAFVVVPVDAHASRLVVRTRNANEPSPADVVLAPFGVGVFEPVHFLMERAMLRGIRERAER